MILIKHNLIKVIGKTLIASALAAAISITGAVDAGAVGVKGTWVPVNGGAAASYLLPDGSYLRDGFTADGYYIGNYGIWAPSIRILSAWVPSRNSWLTPAPTGTFDGFVPFMSSAQAKLTEDLHGFRVITVYNNRITLSSVDVKDYKRTKTTRLAMYKNEDINGYTIKVCTELAGDEKEMPTGGAGEWNEMAYYDYQVLRIFTNLVSRSGDKLAEAIYSSWEDENAYDLRMNKWVTVGDTLVCYLPDEGAGLYEIRAAF